MPEKKRISIKFTPEASGVLKDMAEDKGVTVAELVRRAVNFYQVQMDAEKHHKHILLQRPDGVIERVI